ncbi:MAG: hypothetical protein HZA51_11560 [Planctomycetes bacterium]|nr:hypothetical protein [Planctomycetota bacterium]
MARSKIVAAALVILATSVARAQPLVYCPPLPGGTGCSTSLCSQTGEPCMPRCVRMDNHGNFTVIACECRGTSECHVEFQPFSTPYCVGNCPPAQYCVQNVVMTELGAFDVCCDCLPIQCECPGDVDGNRVLNGLDIAGFVRCYLGFPDYYDNGGCADLSGDGYVTSVDVPMFVTLLLTKAGCPDTPCCPRTNLALNLATGVDDNNILIPDNSDDDNWVVTVDANGGSVPRPATAVFPHPNWVTFPGTKWISANYFGQNGAYVYQYCFCLDDRFRNPLLSLQIRADDEGEIYLNGNLLGSCAGNSDPNPPVLSTSNPGFFQSGQNCITVVVRNTGGAPTGINMTGTVTAADGKCCCPAAPLSKGIASAVYDYSGGLLIPVGQNDDTWRVTVDATGGTVPRPAKVMNPNPLWLTQPGTRWVSAVPTVGASTPGFYTYDYCFCLDPRFKNPVLDMWLRVDDGASIWLNGAQIGVTSPGNAFNTPEPYHIFVTDPRLFRACENCIEIRVFDAGHSTGINVTGSISAVDGLCCDDRTISCCAPSGGCSTLLPGEQQCLGGGAGHDGPCEPAQGCCTGNSCVSLSPRCCRFIGGTVLPTGTPCSPIRACCIPGPGGPCSTCVNIAPECCTAQGGTPGGPGSSCIP